MVSPDGCNKQITASLSINCDIASENFLEILRPRIAESICRNVERSLAFYEAALNWQQVKETRIEFDAR